MGAFCRAGSGDGRMDGWASAGAQQGTRRSWLRWESPFGCCGALCKSPRVGWGWQSPCESSQSPQLGSLQGWGRGGQAGCLSPNPSPQCHPALDGQRGKCWCVDRKTGVKLPGFLELKGDLDCHQLADSM